MHLVIIRKSIKFLGSLLRQADQRKYLLSTVLFSQASPQKVTHNHSRFGESVFVPCSAGARFPGGSNVSFSTSVLAISLPAQFRGFKASASPTLLQAEHRPKKGPSEVNDKARVFMRNET